MQYNKVEISGVNTSELIVLKESEKWSFLRKCAAVISRPEKSL